MAEPTPATIPTAEPTPITEPAESAPAKAAAPKEDFESMSIEELKKIVDAPLERVNPPNKDANKAALDAVDAEIKKAFARFEELKAERVMIKEGFKAINEAKKESIEAHKALIKSRDTLTAQRNEAMATFNKLREEQNTLKDQLKDANRMKPEILEEKIKKAEMKIECESLSIPEEKELNHQITQWKKDLKQASSSKNIVERKEAVDAEIKEVKAKLDSIKKELDAVYEKLGAEKEAAPKKEEGEEKKENPYDRINEEWKKTSELIDLKKKEKKELQADFRAKEKAFREFSFANKRRRAAQFVLERKERELQEAELAKKEEEEALKKHPFEKEMTICDTLISYLKGLEVKETKIATKTTKDIVVPEGMTLLKKEEEVYFAAEPKKSKKNHRDRKTEKKPSNLIHNLVTLESFAAIRLTAPTSLEQVKTCLDNVVARKDFFDKLPRGANVDEELAKLN